MCKYQCQVDTPEERHTLNTCSWRDEQRCATEGMKSAIFASKSPRNNPTGSWRDLSSLGKAWGCDEAVDAERGTAGMSSRDIVRAGRLIG